VRSFLKEKKNYDVTICWFFVNQILLSLIIISFPGYLGVICKNSFFFLIFFFNFEKEQTGRIKRDGWQRRRSQPLKIVVPARHVYWAYKVVGWLLVCIAGPKIGK